MSGKTSKLVYVLVAALLTVILGLSAYAPASGTTDLRPAQMRWLLLAQSDNASSQTPGRAVIEDESWIGIEFDEVTPKVAKRNGLDRAAGAIVLNISPYGGAARAGVRAGDIILAVNGRPALDGKELDKILDAIWPGRTVRFVLLRKGKRIDLDVTLGGLVSDNSAAAKAGNVEAMHLLGLAYDAGRGTKRNIKEAVRWLKKAAKLGNPHAQQALANLYATGDGVPQDDKKTVYWLRKAAKQDHGRAQAYLAEYYKIGRGVPQSDRKAILWYRVAASNGDAMGANGLGIIYTRGSGVKKDHAKAAVYFRLAADKGSYRGMHNLAVSYWHGRGVRQDKREAAKLWRLASLKGSKGANKSLMKFEIAPYDAAEIQRLLAAVGYDPGPADGRPGRKTRSAITQFQTDRDFKVDGKLTLKLYASLLIAEQDLRRAALIERYSLEETVEPETPVADEEDGLQGLD